MKSKKRKKTIIDRSERLSLTSAPWAAVRDGLPEPVKLESPSPRIVTIAHHGAGGLLRTFFPELPEMPEVNITAEHAQKFAMTEMAKKLAGNANLRLGGFSHTATELHALKIPEVSKELEELEPLRAMALKEVTNIQFLVDYTNGQETE